MNDGGRERWRGVEGRHMGTTDYNQSLGKYVMFLAGHSVLSLLSSKDIGAQRKGFNWPQCFELED